MKKFMTILLSVFLLLTLMPNIVAEETLKDYPTDIKIEETENGDIKITSEDQEYLKTLDKNSNYGSGIQEQYYISISNSDFGISFYNNEDKKYDFIEYIEEDKCLIIKNADIKREIPNGEYNVRLTAFGYKDYNYNSLKITKSFDLLDDISEIELSQNETDIILTATGNDAETFFNRLYEGAIEYGYGTDGRNESVGSIYVRLKKNDRTYSASIYNRTFVDHEEKTYYRPIYKVDANHAYISKSYLAKNGFMDGEYTFNITVKGFTSKDNNAIKVDLGKPFEVELCKSIMVNNVFEAIAGQKTDISDFDFGVKAIINDQEVSANDKFRAVILDKDTESMTGDETFVAGKEYILYFSISTNGYEGMDLTPILSYDGKDYNMENPEFRGGTGGTWMDVTTVKVVEIPLKVTAVADLPTANKDLVYTGEELVGVNENEAYTLTDNKATNAGNYIAKAALNEGYVWKDGTTETKRIEWSISKATPKYEIPTDLKAAEGDKLSTVKLPSGWTWKDGNKVVSNVGNVAVYTPSDTNNYLTVEEKLNIELTYKVVVDDSSLELNSKVETENNESTSDNTGDAYVNNDGISASIKDVITNEKSNTVIEGKAKDLIDKAVEATKDGKVVKINVVTTLVKKEKEVTGVTKEELKEIEALTKGLTVQSYLDLSMKLKVETTIEGKEVSDEDSLLKELDKPVELVLKLDLPKDFNAKDYKFYVIAVHENADGSLETSKKEAKYNAQDSTISFETDKFSTYAVAYEKVSTEKPSEPSKPSTPSSKPNYIIPNTSTR